MWIILIWVFFGGAAAIVASGKGRSGLAWFVLGVLFGPFALFVIAFLPKIEISADQITGVPDVRACPYCAETIKSAAIICKHCGHDVDPMIAAISKPAVALEPGPITKSLARHHST